MKVAGLVLVLLSYSSVSFSHSDHMKAPDIQLVTTEGLEKPVMMRSTSVKLLESTIDVTGDHGRGWYFKEEKTEVQKLVNQGFTMLNMFQYTDAFRSFNTALELDPKSVISYVGRAFASVSLDRNQSYYVVISIDFLTQNKEVLTEKQKAWANLLLATVTRKDVDGGSLSAASAYQTLKRVDGDNLEVPVFANWVSKSYDSNGFVKALELDPTNAGATHYLLHLAEGAGDHETALKYGVDMAQFALGSGHGQHMYGHVLPHFNRWVEADKQFEISHEIHKAWAKKNGVHESEDWHYIHNLDLWAVTNMVLNPAKAVIVLEELTSLNLGYAGDMLDFKTVSGTNLDVSDKAIEKMETEEPRLNLSSSRKLHTLISQANDFQGIKGQFLAEGALNWQQDHKDNVLYISAVLVEAHTSNDADLKTRVSGHIISKLSQAFQTGGFDGWRKSVLETMIYLRVAEVYGVSDVREEIMTKVVDVHMNPID